MVGGRYELLEPLGSGAGGTVWRARDRILRDAVALKRLARDVAQDPAQRRREAAALRLLRVPGVVALRDEVVEGDSTHLVLDLVEGRPFPGLPLPARWEDLRERTRALLETLARVHALGVFHGDLKPENVLVEEDGVPRVLDFDLSAGPGVAAREVESGFLAGTPAYLAPEQLRGAAPDARTDLYALGVMLFRSMAGRAPHEAATFQELVHLRTTRAAPSLREAAPPVPAEAVALVDALLALRREDRPADGAAALRLLTAEAEDAAERRAREALAALAPGDEALRAMFHGPDVGLHLREDAARELVRRAGPDRGAQAAELGAWLRAGVARWDGDRLRVDRAMLDAMAEGLVVRPGDDARPVPAAASRAFALLAEGRTKELVEEACLRAARAADEGDGSAAAAVVRAALGGARVSGAAEAEVRLLGWLLYLAVLRTEIAALADALYEIERRATEGDAAQRLEALARALVGSPGEDPAAAAAGARALAPFDEEHLEWARMACIVFAARRLGPEESRAVIAEAERVWAGRSTPLFRAALLKWRGFHEYLHGSFGEAARLLVAAADAAPTWSGRVSAGFDAIMALQAAGHAQEASARIPVLLAALARRRLPALECGVEVARLMAEYQADRPLPDAGELLLAMRILGARNNAGTARGTLAASAWRAGRRDAARALAEEGAASLVAAGSSGSAVEYRALAHLCGATGAGCDAASLLAEGLAPGAPMMRLQALALVALAGHAVPDAWRDVAARAQRVVGEAARATRREVLSWDECVAAIEGTWRPALPGVVPAAGSPSRE